MPGLVPVAPRTRRRRAGSPPPAPRRRRPRRRTARRTPAAPGCRTRRSRRAGSAPDPAAGPPAAPPSSAPPRRPPMCRAAAARTSPAPADGRTPARGSSASSPATPTTSRNDRARRVKELTPRRSRPTLSRRVLTAATGDRLRQLRPARWPPDGPRSRTRCAASDDHSSAKAPTRRPRVDQHVRSVLGTTSIHGARRGAQVDRHQPAARRVPLGAQVQRVAVGRDDVVRVGQLRHHRHRSGSTSTRPSPVVEPAGR